MTKQEGPSTVYLSPCPNAIKDWQIEHELVCMNWMMGFFGWINISLNLFHKNNVFDLNVITKVKFLSVCNNSSHFLFDLELFFCINVTLLVFVQLVTLLFVWSDAI